VQGPVHSKHHKTSVPGMTTRMSAVDSPVGVFQVHAHGGWCVSSACTPQAGGSTPALVARRRHVTQLRLFPVLIAMTCGGTLNVAAASFVRVVPAIRRDVNRA
jgi:hypothetical protein